MFAGKITETNGYKALSKALNKMIAVITILLFLAHKNVVEDWQSGSSGRLPS
jgi:hypothetical protein